jgi:hypothetical protein
MCQCTSHSTCEFLASHRVPHVLDVWLREAAQGQTPSRASSPFPRRMPSLKMRLIATTRSLAVNLFLRTWDLASLAKRDSARHICVCSARSALSRRLLAAH